MWLGDIIKRLGQWLCNPIILWCIQKLNWTQSRLERVFGYKCSLLHTIHRRRKVVIKNRIEIWSLLSLYMLLYMLWQFWCWIHLQKHNKIYVDWYRSSINHQVTNLNHPLTGKSYIIKKKGSRLRLWIIILQSTLHKKKFQSKTMEREETQKKIG